MHWRTEAGRLFHSLGPATEKARLQNFRFVRVAAMDDQSHLDLEAEHGLTMDDMHDREVPKCMWYIRRQILNMIRVLSVWYIQENEIYMHTYYMHTYIHTHVHTYTRIYTRIYTRTYIHTYTYIYACLSSLNISKLQSISKYVTLLFVLLVVSLVSRS